MTAYIVDASVAAKWVLPPTGEPLAEEASRLLERFASGQVQLSVPDLFWAEIGNILRKAARAGRVSEQTAHESMEWFRALGIPTMATRELVGDALTIAFATHRSAYDALYVAVAVESGRSLITADERLVQGAAARFPVQWLGSVI